MVKCGWKGWSKTLNKNQKLNWEAQRSAGTGLHTVWPQGPLTTPKHARNLLRWRDASERSSFNCSWVISDMLKIVSSHFDLLEWSAHRFETIFASARFVSKGRDADDAVIAWDQYWKYPVLFRNAPFAFVFSAHKCCELNIGNVSQPATTQILQKHIAATESGSR